MKQEALLNAWHCNVLIIGRPGNPALCHIGAGNSQFSVAGARDLRRRGAQTAVVPADESGYRASRRQQARAGPGRGGKGRPMRVVLAGLAALAALAGGVPAAASTVGAGRVSGTPSWAIQATPLPRGATTGYLPSVSCVTPADCVAVGSHFQTSGPRNQLRGGALAEHWTGGAWRLQPVPSPAGPNKFVNLSAVSCDSAASCTAVGNYQNRAGNYFTLAEHWNGSTWSILATPTPPGVAYVNLNAVWCDSAASCVAAGYYAVGVTSGGGAALVERWDGSDWTIEPTPANPPGTYVSILDAVSCTSAASCTAVGASYASTSPTIRPLAERWDGS